MALSTDYTWAWEVTSIRRRNSQNTEGATLSNAVVQTFWKLTGTNGSGEAGEFSGATPLDPTNTPAGSFVAFDDLTEDSVLGWIQPVVVNDQGYCDHIADMIRRQIEETVTEDASMPWAPEDVTPVPDAHGEAEDAVEDSDPE